MKIYKASNVNATYQDEVYVAVDESGKVQGYIPEALTFAGLKVEVPNCTWDDHNGENFADFVCGEYEEVL